MTPAPPPPSIRLAVIPADSDVFPRAARGNASLSAGITASSSFGGGAVGGTTGAGAGRA